MVTKPNTTGKATKNDEVMTPEIVAELMVNHFNPSGVCLEPCRGTGNILKFLPEGSEWCEINEGKDFFEYNKKVDWIITNPLYSIYDLFLEKCFEVADNVVLLVPLSKVMKSAKVQRMVHSYGGLKEILVLGSGSKLGFPFGFLSGAIHYQRGYRGYIKYTDMMDTRVNWLTD